MKTMIDVPETALRQAEQAAAAQGLTLGQLLIQGFEKPTSTAKTSEPDALTPDEAKHMELDKHGMPVLKRTSGPRITVEQLNRFRDELGV